MGHKESNSLECDEVEENLRHPSKRIRAEWPVGIDCRHDGLSVHSGPQHMGTSFTHSVTHTTSIPNQRQGMSSGPE